MTNYISILKEFDKAILSENQKLERNYQRLVEETEDDGEIEANEATEDQQNSQEQEADQDKSASKAMAGNSNIDTVLKNLILTCKNMGGRPQKLANLAQRLNETTQLDEADQNSKGFGKALVYTILGLSMAMNAIGGGLYAMNLQGKKDAKAKEFAELMNAKQVEKRAKGVCNQVYILLNSIEDSITALDGLSDSDEAVFQGMLDEAERQAKEAALNAKFDEIMKS